MWVTRSVGEIGKIGVPAFGLARKFFADRLSESRATERRVRNIHSFHPWPVRERRVSGLPHANHAGGPNLPAAMSGLLVCDAKIVGKGRAAFIAITPFGEENCEAIHPSNYHLSTEHRCGLSAANWVQELDEGRGYPCSSSFAATSFLPKSWVPGIVKPFYHIQRDGFVACIRK